MYLTALLLFDFRCVAHLCLWKFYSAI